MWAVCGKSRSKTLDVWIVGIAAAVAGCGTWVVGRGKYVGLKDVGWDGGFAATAESD